MKFFLHKYLYITYSRPFSVDIGSCLRTLVEQYSDSFDSKSDHFPERFQVGCIHLRTTKVGDIGPLKDVVEVKIYVTKRNFSDVFTGTGGLKLLVFNEKRI